MKNMPAESGFRERFHSGEQQIEKLTVRTETLDRCLPDGYVPTLIKIDVEGAELQVFEGAIETISRYKPIIIFEHGKGGATFYDTQPQHIYQLLTIWLVCAFSTWMAMAHTRSINLNKPLPGMLAGII